MSGGLCCLLQTLQGDDQLDGRVTLNVALGNRRLAVARRNQNDRAFLNVVEDALGNSKYVGAGEILRDPVSPLSRVVCVFVRRWEKKGHRASLLEKASSRVQERQPIVRPPR